MGKKCLHGFSNPDFCSDCLARKHRRSPVARLYDEGEENRKVSGGKKNVLEPPKRRLAEIIGRNLDMEDGEDDILEEEEVQGMHDPRIPVTEGNLIEEVRTASFKDSQKAETVSKGRKKKRNLLA